MDRQHKYFEWEVWNETLLKVSSSFLTTSPDVRSFRWKDPTLRSSCCISNTLPEPEFTVNTTTAILAHQGSPDLWGALLSSLGCD